MSRLETIMKNRVKADMKSFCQGFICACTALQVGHGESSLVAELLKGCGITKERLLEYGDKYDIEVLLPLYKTESYLENNKNKIV